MYVYLRNIHNFGLVLFCFILKAAIESPNLLRELTTPNVIECLHVCVCAITRIDNMYSTSNNTTPTTPSTPDAKQVNAMRIFLVFA